MSFPSTPVYFASRPHRFSRESRRKKEARRARYEELKKAPAQHDPFIRRREASGSEIVVRLLLGIEREFNRFIERVEDTVKNAFRLSLAAWLIQDENWRALTEEGKTDEVLMRRYLKGRHQKSERLIFELCCKANHIELPPFVAKHSLLVKKMFGNIDEVQEEAMRETLHQIRLEREMYNRRDDWPVIRDRWIRRISEQLEIPADKVEKLVKSS